MNDQSGVARRMVRSFRPLYTQAIERSPTLRLMMHYAAGQIDRTTPFVREGYEKVWNDFHAHLERCRSVDEWLYIPGVEDLPRGYRVDHRLRYRPYDFSRFEIETLVGAIRKHFPTAQSVTEYGCGVGRIILGIKQAMPELRCAGYELAEPGVAVAKRAAAKFGLDVAYAPLDYVNDGPEHYVHPPSDVSITVFSLEQVPTAHTKALGHMLERSRLGTMHIEPVAENYPKSYGGMLGRLYSAKTDYLRGFDAGVGTFDLAAKHVRVLATSHNPLIYPSLYVLEKRA